MNNTVPMSPNGVADDFLAPDTSNTSHRHQPVPLHHHPASTVPTKTDSSNVFDGSQRNNDDYHTTLSQHQQQNNYALQNGGDDNKITNNQQHFPRNNNSFAQNGSSVEKTRQQQLSNGGEHGATRAAAHTLVQPETFASSRSPPPPPQSTLLNVVAATNGKSDTLGTVNSDEFSSQPQVEQSSSVRQQSAAADAAVTTPTPAVLLNDWPPKRPSSSATTHAAGGVGKQRASRAHEAFERQRTKFNAQHNYFNEQQPPSSNNSAVSPPPPPKNFVAVRDISGRNVVQPVNDVVEATRRSRSRTPPPQPRRHLIDDDKARRQYHLTSGRTTEEDEISAAIDKVFIQLSEFDVEELARPPKKVPLCDQKAFEDPLHRYRAVSPLHSSSKMPSYPSNNNSRQPQYEPQHYYQQPATQFVQYQSTPHPHSYQNGRPDSSMGSSGITEGGSTASTSTSNRNNGNYQKPVDFSGFDLNSEYHIGLGGESGFGGGDFRLIDDIYERARNKRLTLDKVEGERRRHNYVAPAPMRSPIPDNRYDSAFDEQDSLSRRVDNLIGSRANALKAVSRSGSFRRGRSLSSAPDSENKLRGTSAKVLYDFRPSTSRELALREGDIVHIHEQLDQNWCEGECNGRIGIFAIAYIEPHCRTRTDIQLKPARQRTSNSQSTDYNNNHNNARTQSPSVARPSSNAGNNIDYRYGSSPTLLAVNKYDDADFFHLNKNPITTNASSELGYANAIFDFKAQNSYEMSCKKGELLVLIRRVDQNWYEARVPNTTRRGIVPANYIQIQRVTTSTTPVVNNSAVPASPIRKSAASAAPFTPAFAAGSAAESDDDILSQRSGEVRRLRPSSRVSSGTATYPPVNNSNRPILNGLHNSSSNLGSSSISGQEPSPSSQLLLQRRPSFRRDSISSTAVDAYGNIISRNDPGADRYLLGNNVIDELAGKLKSQKSLIENIVGGGGPQSPRSPQQPPAANQGVGAYIRSQSRQSIDGGDRRNSVIFEHALAPSASVGQHHASSLMNGGGDDRPTSPQGSIISSINGGGGAYAQYRRQRHDSDASPDAQKFISAPDTTPQRDRTSQHYTPDKLLQMQQMHEQKGEPQPYRVLYSYAPQNDDELELREGDRVYVFEKCDDNWYVGTTARGEFGVFPGNYVTPMF